jgi:cysteine-rich repeat protein
MAEDATGSDGDVPTTGVSPPLTDWGGAGSGDPLSCGQPVECGDGLVVPGEACDDANAVETDGCTTDCRRTAPQKVATLDFGTVYNAVFLDDGSVVVLSLAGEVARFGADGGALWRGALVDEGTYVYPRAVLDGGEQVLVLGAVGGPVATLWRFAGDGTLIAVEAFAEDPYLEDGALASDGGIVALTGERVVRFATDGSELWSQVVSHSSHDGAFGVALAADDVAFLTATSYWSYSAMILRATPGDVRITPVELPELTNPRMNAIAPTPDGGAVAAGDDMGRVIVVRVDADGEIVWASTCSTHGLGAIPTLVSVVDDRILIAGFRPPEGCDDLYYCGSQVVWMQQLAPNGTVIATDEPSSLLGMDQPDEYPVAIAGRSSQGITMVVMDGEAGQSGLVRFPW